NVHVSMIGFDDGKQKERLLDGCPTSEINPNLTSGSNLTTASALHENEGIQFEADKKGGPFEIDASAARKILSQPALGERKIATVCRRWVNGSDVTGRDRGLWIIDFGTDTTIEEAASYESAFQHVKDFVAPKYASSRKRWWLHERPRPAMRAALAK